MSLSKDGFTPVASTGPCPDNLRLWNATARAERWRAYCCLVEKHGEVIVVESRRLAHVVGLRSDDGDEAINKAFIRIGKQLVDPWPEGKLFLDHYRYVIWSELRHSRTELFKFRVRYCPLSESFDPQADTADPERQYRSAELLLLILKRLERLSSTEDKKVLLKAFRLSKEGYKWAEIHEELAWNGTCDGLRISVARLFGPLKGLLQSQIGW